MVQSGTVLAPDDAKSTENRQVILCSRQSGKMAEQLFLPLVLHPLTNQFFITGNEVFILRQLLQILRERDVEAFLKRRPLLQPFIPLLNEWKFCEIKIPED